MTLNVKQLYYILDNMLKDKQVQKLNKAINMVENESLLFTAVQTLQNVGGIQDLFETKNSDEDLHLVEKDGRIHYFITKGFVMQGEGSLPVTDEVLQSFPLTAEGEKFVQLYL